MEFLRKILMIDHLPTAKSMGTATKHTSSSNAKLQKNVFLSRKRNICFLAALLVLLLQAAIDTSFLLPIDGYLAEHTAKEKNSSSSYCPQEPCHVSIVFMGDSLTRFMYYSLAYFLRHNEWIDPDSYPNLVKPADFLGGYELKFDWVHWYNSSTAALAPYENCDCHREKSDIMLNPGKEWICENRYYYDRTRNNTVVYFQSFGNFIPIRGHWEDPQEATRAAQLLQVVKKLASASNRSVGDENENVTVGPLLGRHPYTWSYDWPTTIRHQVARIKPNVLVMNAGIWPHDFDKPDFVESIVAAINETGIPQTIWKTTSSDKNGRFERYMETDEAMCRHEFFQRDCLNITGWTSKLNEDHYIDHIHFREPVYRKMNEQLLENLGISQGGSRMLNWTDLGIADDNI